MKILVCVSKTPDTTAKVSFTPDGKAYNSDGVQFIMNPYDEWYALVRAVELVEAQGGSVTIINVGDASNDIIIRKGLAIGANDAVRINMEAKDAYSTAKAIADYAAAQKYDLILTGKESIDFNGSEVGGMIAGFLDLPYLSYASHLEMDGSTATVHREVEGGKEVVKVSGPFVLSAAKGLAEQRIPNMRGIMMAKSKPLQVVEASAINIGVETQKFTLPEEKSGVHMLQPDQMDELVRLLHEEAKVI